MNAYEVATRASRVLAQVYSEDGVTGTPDKVDNAIGEALLILGEITAAEMLGSRATVKATGVAGHIASWPPVTVPYIGFPTVSVVCDDSTAGMYSLGELNIEPTTGEQA